MSSGPLYSLLRHDRPVVLTGLGVVVMIAWLYLLLGAGGAMDTMDMGGGQMMLMAPSWTPGYAALILLMWAIMMVAMMLPSAAPTILLVANIARSRAATAGGMPTAALFALGYIVVWAGFSVAATLLQWSLDRLGILSDAMASRSAAVAGLILVAAGLYEWTPLKQSCLRHCRSPLDFLIRNWRKATWGGAVIGMRHGFFCLGCCWMLMALLFVGGLMNVLWIAALALLVLVEKTLPWGGRMSRVTGIVLVVWGAVTLASVAFS
jgi:predicted metal-binding membrane protein